MPQPRTIPSLSTPTAMRRPSLQRAVSPPANRRSTHVRALASRQARYRANRVAMAPHLAGLIDGRNEVPFLDDEAGRQIPQGWADSCRSWFREEDLATPACGVGQMLQTLVKAEGATLSQRPAASVLCTMAVVLAGRGESFQQAARCPADSTPLPRRPSARLAAVIDWATGLLVAPMQTMAAARRQPGGAAMLLQMVRRGAGSFALHRGDPGQATLAWHAEPWARCAALLALSSPLWLRVVAPTEHDTPASMLQKVLSEQALPPSVIDALLGDAALRPGNGVDWLRSGHPSDLAMDLTPLVWLVAADQGLRVHTVLQRLRSDAAPQHHGWPDLSGREITRVAQLSSGGGAVGVGGLRALAELVRCGGMVADFQHLPPWLRWLSQHNRALVPQTLAWLGRNRHALTQADWPLVLDWAYEQDVNRFFCDPPFSWRGRTADSARTAALLRRRAKLQARPDLPASWPGQAWVDCLPDPDTAGRTWAYIELDNVQALHQEVWSMHHCVATRWERCALGEVLVFSVRCNGDRRVTLEVDPVDRSILQVRGAWNRMPDGEECAAVRRWAAALGLVVAAWSGVC